MLGFSIFTSRIWSVFRTRLQNVHEKNEYDKVHSFLKHCSNIRTPMWTLNLIAVSNQDVLEDISLIVVVIDLIDKNLVLC